MAGNIEILGKRLDGLLPGDRTMYAPIALNEAATLWSDAIWQEATRMGAIQLREDEIAAAFQLCWRPVFVCGVHRSGTTLVRDLLDWHPSLSVLPAEGSFITQTEPVLSRLNKTEHMAWVGKEWLRRLANPINKPPYWLLGNVADHAPYVKFARYFMAWWQALPVNANNSFRPHLAVVLAYTCCTGGISNKMYWVDKTPTNERFLARLWQEFPQAKIIQVVRHPVDVLLSRKKMEPGTKPGRFIRDLDTSFKVAVKQSQRTDNRYLLIRYEELCRQPEAITAQVAHFLGIQPTKELTIPTIAGRPAAANSSFSRNFPAGRIIDSRPQRNNALPDAEERMLIAITGRNAGKLGYYMPTAGRTHTFFSKAGLGWLQAGQKQRLYTIFTETLLYGIRKGFR